MIPVTIHNKRRIFTAIKIPDGNREDHIKTSPGNADTIIIASLLFLPGITGRKSISLVMEPDNMVEE